MKTTFVLSFFLCYLEVILHFYLPCWLWTPVWREYASRAITLLMKRLALGNNAKANLMVYSLTTWNFVSSWPTVIIRDSTLNLEFQGGKSKELQQLRVYNPNCLCQSRDNCQFTSKLYCLGGNFIINVHSRFTLHLLHMWSKAFNPGWKLKRNAALLLSLFAIPIVGLNVAVFHTRRAKPFHQ